MKRWPFARKSTAATGAASSAAASSSASATPASSPIGGVEDEFAAWFERSWPGSVAASSIASSSSSSHSAIASPARTPGTGSITTAPGSSSPLKLFEKRGEYYCAYGADALFIADFYYKTREVIKFISMRHGARLAVVSLSPRKLSSILQKEVMSKGESVEIWRKGAGASGGGTGEEEEEEEEEAKSSGSSNNLGWSLLYRATPGSLDGLEELLGFSLAAGGGESSISVAIRLASSALSGSTTESSAEPSGQRIVGAAFIDPRMRIVRLLDIADDSSLTGLENALISQGVREAFLLMPPRAAVSALALEWKRVAEILAESKIPVQQARNPKAAAAAGSSSKAAAAAMVDDPSATSASPTDDAIELQNLSSGAGPSTLSLSDLHELARYVAPTSPLSLIAPGVMQSKKQSLLCMQFLLRTLGIPVPEDDASRFTLREVRLHDVCRLDQAAVQALSLFPRGDETDRSMSLFGVLDKTRSAMGSRMMATFIRQPLVNRDKIVVRQDSVELFVNNAGLRDQLRESLFKSLPDLGRLCTRFQKRTARLDDVMIMYEFGCVRLVRIRDALVEFAAENAGYTSSVTAPTAAELAASENRDGGAPSPLRLSVLDRLHSDFITPLSTQIQALTPFAHMVEQAVQIEDESSVAAGDDAPAWERKGGRVSYIVNPAIHPTLTAIAAARSEARAGLDKEVAAIHNAVWVSSNESISPKLAFNPLRDFGFHLRLTKTEMKKWNGGEGMNIPGGSSSIRVLEQRKDGLHFTTRRLEKWSNQLSAVRKEFQTASEQLLADVLATTATYTPVIDSISDLVAAPIRERMESTTVMQLPSAAGMKLPI